MRKFSPPILASLWLCCTWGILDDAEAAVAPLGDLAELRQQMWWNLQASFPQELAEEGHVSDGDGAGRLRKAM